VIEPSNRHGSSSEELAPSQGLEAPLLNPRKAKVSRAPHVGLKLVTSLMGPPSPHSGLVKQRSIPVLPCSEATRDGSSALRRVSNQRLPGLVVP
jgi:hypothetical protein